MNQHQSKRKSSVPIPGIDIIYHHFQCLPALSKREPASLVGFHSRNVIHFARPFFHSRPKWFDESRPTWKIWKSSLTRRSFTPCHWSVNQRHPRWPRPQSWPLQPRPLFSNSLSLLRWVHSSGQNSGTHLLMIFRDRSDWLAKEGRLGGDGQNFSVGKTS